MRGGAGVALCALALGGCGAPPEREATGAALFEQGFSRPIVDSGGRQIGSVGGEPGGAGVTLRIEARGLAPGNHGMHLHAAGRCDTPDFASRGAHWNAQGRAHGHDNPGGPHDGDFGNLTIGADGSGATDRLIPRWHGRIPDEGLALVIHESDDDERTDPDGGSGAPIACAIVLPPG